MANPRKTQGEIDKLLKKIGEGMEVYEEVFDKFADAPSQALKERFESDLKKEIKKLQRLREQIRSLVQNPEVKDKKALEAARRRIEEKMEAFKVCERETKTKAFSKEGLANARSDNAETPVERTENWLKSAIADLKEQAETVEFEIQNESGGVKKKKKDDPRDAKLIRLKYNTLKLEQLLRLVTNEELLPEEVDEIEDDVQRYLDENNDEEFEEDTELYDRFDLPDVVVKAAGESEDEETTQAQAQAQQPPAPAAKKAPATPAAPPTKAAVQPVPKKEEGGRVVVPPKAAATPDTPPSNPSSAATKASTPSVAAVVAKAAAAAAAPASAAAKKESTPAAAAAPAPAPAKKAVPTSASPMSPNMGQQASPASAPSSSTSRQQTFPAAKPKDEPIGGDELLDDDIDEANDDTFGDDAMPVTSSVTLADMAQATHHMTTTSDWDRGRPNIVPQPKPTPAAAAAQQASPNTPSTISTPVPRSQQQQAKEPVSQQGGSQATASAAQPSSSVPSAWNAQQLLKPQQLSQERQQTDRMFEMSVLNLPHPHDVERVKPFAPPNPYRTPAYYPHQVHPGFSTPEMFAKFDHDTLFFIFYYQQSTYQQYLAAKELKKKSFRYHKKYRTWFQRHEKPKITTDEYESGTYLYFDYENGWCQRIKNDFQFKYNYLEDELV